MNRVWKSAFASIFGLVDQIEMILTSNLFILTSLNMHLSLTQFTQFLLSFGFSLVSGFCRANKAKGSVFFIGSFISFIHEMSPKAKNRANFHYKRCPNWGNVKYEEISKKCKQTGIFQKTLLHIQI